MRRSPMERYFAAYSKGYTENDSLSVFEDVCRHVTESITYSWTMWDMCYLPMTYCANVDRLWTHFVPKVGRLINWFECNVDVTFAEIKGLLVGAMYMTAMEIYVVFYANGHTERTLRWCNVYVTDGDIYAAAYSNGYTEHWNIGRFVSLIVLSAISVSLLDWYVWQSIQLDRLCWCLKMSLNWFTYSRATCVTRQMLFQCWTFDSLIWVQCRRHIWVFMTEKDF
jgi:hypothetical protein